MDTECECQRVATQTTPVRRIPTLDVDLRVRRFHRDDTRRIHNLFLEETRCLVWPMFAQAIRSPPAVILHLLFMAVGAMLARSFVIALFGVILTAAAIFVYTYRWFYQYLTSSLKGDLANISQLKEFEIIGRRLPSEKNSSPPLYKMRIFAPDDVVAKSKYWYFVAKLKKIKKSNGEVVSCREIFEKKPLRIKNFGVWLRYDSRSGTHNMYREYRDLTVASAVTSCYRDMAARHRARGSSIQIMKVDVIPASKCRRPHMKQLHNSKIKFPLPHRIIKSHYKSKFVAKRPNTFY
ncbi:large ribosomal subunit protein eL20 isoform X2 [Pocillopora verrucosa]|uniref:60S ribosomal protein L18a-like isoform X2 n=1 Tax=Pocillopora damicornis TaxID=46731 RepID=UPI000F54E695|nr:60S ribosomal protein L18a-like isoform X2 [Pocillopora damicornis]XP_058954145.1 large ribosomal subunit protein eL20-like isoform X2 [Pocillopora verrucosa]